jgi:hypothetical protein
MVFGPLTRQHNRAIGEFAPSQGTDLGRALSGQHQQSDNRGEIIVAGRAPDHFQFGQPEHAIPAFLFVRFWAADRRVLLHEPVLDRPCIEAADGCL